MQSEIKYLTTQCAVIEAESLGSKVSRAVQILKRYAIHKCGHEGKPIPGAECFLSMVRRNNEKHYIIATQDRELQNILRATPAVPLLYLHQKAPILEKPSDLSVEVAKQKFSPLTDWEKTTLATLKQKSVIVGDEVKKPKKKKQKGANPLSCMKKKNKSGNMQGVCKKEKSSEVKKRKKVRIPKHVKEELLKLNNASS